MTDAETPVATSADSPVVMPIRAVRAWLFVGLLSIPPLLANADPVANAAQQPILGGLGLLFGKPPPAVGGELEALPAMVLPSNRGEIVIPEGIPGAVLPWRTLPNPSLPHRFRDQPSRAYTMLDSQGNVMRALALVADADCDQDFAWLKRILTKKYGIRGELIDLSPDEPHQHHRILSSDHQIDVVCGRDGLRLDYGDYGALTSWAAQGRRALRQYERIAQEAAEQHLILKRRRAVRLADRFTLGGGHRLHGGFGVRFREPYAAPGTFPVDEAVAVELPEFDPKFDQGQFTIELDPEMRPITIRGRFKDVSFEALADALNAKYGGAMKATDRHVVHKVSDYHIVLRAYPNRTEVAFIDAQLRREQQARRWAAESEGV